MSSTRHFVIATAGHVDHGKSSLVKALTGTDPDRLPEEKARQITIDLGFAELNLRGPNNENIHVAIVDVPGHEDFVRNMIAGVGSIDLALFVVAADDGWMPQTEEHLQILEYLGVLNAVVALTKIDLGDPEKVEGQIRDRLGGSPFVDAPIVAVSVKTGIGLELLQVTIAQSLSGMQQQRDIGKPRLFVDRAFTLRGIGTVATGTLTGGNFRRGDSVIIQPKNFGARLRSLQSHGRDVDLAMPGMRTAMNLPDVELDSQLCRGDTVTVSGFKTSQILGVSLVKSPRSLPRPLKNRTRAYFHHGTSRIAATIRLIEKDCLNRGEAAIARVHLDRPIVAFLGDRFVLRDPSERSTIAGGMVLDPNGNLDSDLLRERATSPNDVDLCVRTEIRASRAASISTLLHQSHFSREEITAAAERSAVGVSRGLAVDRAHWDVLRRRAVDLVDSIHRAEPDRLGLELNEFRAEFRDESPELIDALIDHLCENEFIRAKSTVARREHKPMLPPQLRASADQILERLSTKPFDPPSRRRAADTQETQDVLRFLITNGDVIELGSEVILIADAFEEMKRDVVAFISKNGAATVSELRQNLNSSRRVIVPLLERLDRDGVTRRVGDRRKLADDIVAVR